MIAVAREYDIAGRDRNSRLSYRDDYLIARSHSTRPTERASRTSITAPKSLSVWTYWPFATDPSVFVTLAFYCALITLLQSYPSPGRLIGVFLNLFRKQDVNTITGNTTEKIGWDTDQKSNAYAIDTLKKDLKEGRCVPHSIEAYDELRVFIHGERGKMGALKGHHDDRVMALSLANVAAQQAGIGAILFG